MCDDTHGNAAPESAGLWGNLLNGALMVAVIAAIGSAAVEYVNLGPERCKIATEFLMDDKKDTTIVTEEVASTMRDLYVKMAVKHCGEN